MNWMVRCVTVYLFANITTVGAAELLHREVSERLISPISNGKVSNFTISPDGNRVAYLATAESRDSDPSGRDPGDYGPSVIILDGKKGRVYDQIEQFRQPIFSPDGKRLAYIAHRRGKPYINVDGRELEHYGEGSIRDTWIRGAHSLQFSPDSRHFAYVADSGNANGPEFVVLDGKQLKPYSGVNGIVFSPDGNRLAYVATDRQHKHFVVLDGQEGKRYRSMISSDNNFVFSPDSKRFAYRASTDDGRGVAIVVDGREGKQYMGAEIDLTFSPDSRRYLYSAQVGSAGKRVLVVDGKEGVHYEGIIRNPMFSPDSARIVYVVSKGGDNGERFVVADGKEGKHYNGRNVWLDYALFSPNSRRIAYPVRLDNKWFVVLDDKEGSRYDSLGHIEFSPDSGHVAYVAQRGTKQFVVLDGQEGKQYDRVGAPVFSPDSKTLAYAAYTDKYKKWFVVVNGQEGKSFERILDDEVFHQLTKRFIRPGNPRFDSPTKLRYLVEKNNNVYQISEAISSSVARTAGIPNWHDKRSGNDCPLRTETVGILVGDDVNLRETPTTESKVLRTVSRGTHVRIFERDDHCTTIAEQTGRWVRVYVMDNKATAGWLFEPFVSYDKYKPLDGKVDRTIGMCHLAENPAREVAPGKYSAVNGLSMLVGVANYFYSVENWRIEHSGRVSVIQQPMHGALQGDENGNYYYLPKNPDYLGDDRAMFLAEMSGLKIKVVLDIRVMRGVPGGTDGYDPYMDEKLCPNGMYWKISLNQHLLFALSSSARADHNLRQ